MGRTRAETDLEGAVARSVGGLELPGLVAAGSIGGVTSIELTQGWADCELESAVNPDTIFALASVSKVYTALTVMGLVEAGRLRLDDPIGSLLGSDHPVLAGVRVHHLLSHTSGLPGLPTRRHILNLAQPGDGAGGIRDHVGLLGYLDGLEIEPLGPPGRWVNYSNDGYGLLAGVIEVVSGSAFATTVAQQVLTPAGLDRTAVGLGAARALGDVASEYDCGSRAPGWDAPAFYGAGGAYSSTRDLLRLGQALFEPAAGVTQATIAAMTAGDGDLHTPGRYYGYGIQVTPGWDGATLLFHGGGRPGARAHLLVAPKEGAVAVALSNDVRAPVDVIATKVLAALLGQPLDRPLPEPFAGEPRRAVSPAQLRRVVGRYRTAEGLDLQINVADGELRLNRNGTALDLVAVQPDVFVCSDGKTVRFLGPRSRPPWGVALPIRIATRRELVRGRDA